MYRFVYLGTIHVEHKYIIHNVNKMDCYENAPFIKFHYNNTSIKYTE